MAARMLSISSKIILLFISLSVVGCTDKSKELAGSWVLQSEIPVYYRFNPDKTFIVNFLNPQTKRVMAVAGGSYAIEDDRLTLKRDGADEVLTQVFDVEKDQMTWVTLTDVKGYEEKVLLQRVDVNLYTPEHFNSLDLDSQYNTYLK